MHSSHGGLVFCMHRPLDAGCTRAIGAVVARFVHTEEVTGSNPVSPTKKGPRISGGLLRFWGFLDGSVVAAWHSRMSSLTTNVPRSKVTSQGPGYQADTTQPIAAVRGTRGFSVGSTRRTHQVATLWAARSIEPGGPLYDACAPVLDGRHCQSRSWSTCPFRGDRFQFSHHLP